LGCLNFEDLNDYQIMSNNTKIILSDTELSNVNDTSWILTKQKITQKVFELMKLQVDFLSVYGKSLLGSFALPEIIASVPRISKGENYLGLPYVMLDYPAVFSKNDVFALRTMFWWGHHFSMMLLLEGSYKKMAAPGIAELLKKNKENIFICVHDNQWQHSFDAENFKDAALISPQEMDTIIFDKKFIKIGLKYSLQNWNELPQLLPAGYTKLLALLP